MSRLRQRRARFAALVAVLVIILLYVVYRSGGVFPQRIPPTLDSLTTSSKSNDGDSDLLLLHTSGLVSSSSLARSNEPSSVVSTSLFLQLPTSEIATTTSIANALNKGHLSSDSLPSAHISEPATPSSKECVRYETLQQLKQKPFSAGTRQFPYSRPSPECRTFTLPSLEAVIERMKGSIKDPDLFRLFENSYPNTLDTCIKWRGYANATDPDTGVSSMTDEELAFVITGDIDAMWLRDSASQIYSYLSLLEPSSDPNSLASLWRGMINSHSRYIIISPYCHSFQPPPEAGISPTFNGAYKNNRPIPPYDRDKVFDCKWELDSLASFLQLSTAYYERTGDLEFFQKYTWIDGVQAAVDAAGAMRLGTYSKEGKVENSAFTFVGWTNRGSETLTNDGLGNPTKENGMVRTAFRPSDDACIFQLLVPANMMWAKYLEDASLIVEKLKDERASSLTTKMRDQAAGIRAGIEKHAVVPHKEFGNIFAYEVDGYGGTNLMDDANIPSLLAMPLWNWTKPTNVSQKDYIETYMNTRNFVLSDSNPYYMQGPVLSAVGGPHLGPGKGWPMAAIVRALTAFSLNDKTGSGKRLKTKEEVKREVKEQIRMVLDSTAGTGVVHESVNAWNEDDWSRAWFGWANGLFGELIMKVEVEIPSILDESWQ